MLFLGFAVGAFAWCVGISVLVSWTRKIVGAGLLRGIYTVSSLATACFALEMLWTIIHGTILPLFSSVAAGLPEGVARGS